LLLFIVTAVVLFIIAGSAAIGVWIWRELKIPYYQAGDKETFIEIPRGSNSTQVAGLLVDSGILHSRLPFIIYIRHTDIGRHIQAGEYRFSGKATPEEIAHRLARGDVYYRSITVPEGLTARETIDLLAKNGLGNPIEMEQALLNVEWIKDLDPNARNLEGYLFPETYRFGRKTDSDTIIKTMVVQFRSKISEILKQYSLPPDWSVSQVVILASMIEKEVKKPEEGPLVASVLTNRLEKKMPLACDATIIYAMKLAGTYEGRLSKSDLKMQSPYNSYTHLNLPPGPISNPGSGSLRAALNPARTDFLYYVSRNDGTHKFSSDFRSHINAVARYQKSIAGRKNRS
jgi:UPF0755 protein